MKKIFSFFKYLFSKGSIISVILSVVSAILAILTFFGGKIEHPANFFGTIFNTLIENRSFLWGSFVFFSIVFFYYQAYRINQWFTLGYKAYFRINLDENWDYSGDWSITKNNELNITNSGAGGITKKGALWENYTFSFDAKIINKCLGVVVRAIDLNNYYMFQIDSEKINPHRRVSRPIFKIDKDQEKDEEKIIISHYEMGWQKMKEISVFHRKKLDSWFHVDVEVKGQTISIYIDNELVFLKHNLIENPYGKVGFRDDDVEQAVVKKIRVTMN